VSDDQKPVYLSFCRQCGGATGACCDEIERSNDVARWVAECIRGGLIIERGNNVDVKLASWCECTSANGLLSDVEVQP
jgi:hypothetical protein